MSAWSGCEVKLGTCHCFAIPLPPFTHAFPWVVIADDRQRVRGGDPSARSVRRNHFSRHHGHSDGKTVNSSPSRSRSLTTSARRPSLHTTRGQPPGGWSNRENCKDWLQSHLQQHCSTMSPKDDSKLSNSNSNQIPRDGISFQVALLPDPSGHTRGCLE